MAIILAKMEIAVNNSLKFEKQSGFLLARQWCLWPGGYQPIKETQGLIMNELSNNELIELAGLLKKMAEL